MPLLLHRLRAGRRWIPAIGRVWFPALALAPLLLSPGRLPGQCLPPPPAGARVLDRIAAIVAGRPILASQVRQAAWYERFSAAPPPARLAPARLRPADCRRALRHLINEALIAAAMPAKFPRPRLSPQLARLEPQYGGRAGLVRAWSRFHLRPLQARRIMRRQLTLLAFLDRKFAARVHIATAEVRGYYSRVFCPLARRHRLRPAPLPAVRPLILAILRRRRLARLEQAWLLRQRRHAAIRVRLRWPAAARRRPSE